METRCFFFSGRFLEMMARQILDITVSMVICFVGDEVFGLVMVWNIK